MREWKIAALLPLALLAACGGNGPRPGSAGQLPPTRGTANTPPHPSPGKPAVPQRAPELHAAPGLEAVIGANAESLLQQFGTPRLDVNEGDVRKLQFSGQPCVLDIYLYPLSTGANPIATHVDARRASDGREVDRASCVSALRQR